ncbi:MAG: hypothetical protein GX046_05845 [Tissierellia bacterium]|jgi:hypothetical protein|nr:hypothetical protein [Tissierellia bacterium]
MYKATQIYKYEIVLPELIASKKDELRYFSKTFEEISLIGMNGVLIFEVETAEKSEADEIERIIRGFIEVLTRKPRTV